MRTLIALLLLTTQASASIYSSPNIEIKLRGKRYTVTVFETYNEAVNEAAKFGCQVFTDVDTDGGVMICGSEITKPMRISSGIEQD
jgi:hypothetical protein